MGDEFKELTIEELARGYVVEDNEKICRCLFCGEHFESGVIYSSRDKMVTAERAVKEHVYDIHGGAFNSLISMDKQFNGLSESQRVLLSCIYDDMDNKRISEEMNISATTVRTHKFNLQKSKREAKILLALIEQVENQELVQERKANLVEKKELEDKDILTTGFDGNMLHPFFTQHNLK